MAETTAAKPHSLSLSSRKNLLLTGVCDVKSYDDRRINLVTSMGGLLICGSELKISKVNTESGEAEIEGIVKLIEYSEKGVQKGVLRKLMR